jgi:aryl-alcohol dehydrogenase-like predicted oxidoreductase
LNTRRIGPFEVSAVSLGCMNLSHAYGAPPPPVQAEALLHRALELGVTMLDTAALYGFGSNEALLGRALKGQRHRFVLASKGGMAGVTGADGITKRVIDGRPETIRRNCEDSLLRLQVETIDLYYLHRWDKAVPIEETVGAMARLVEQGKVRALGLSEVSAATLRRAHAVHPIVAVQSEYSLWSRNVEIGVLQTCRDIGAALVAFSPTARAFLTGALRDVSTLDAKDIRRGMPRFYPDNYARNLQLLSGYEAIARDAGSSMAQLAIAWVLSRGEHVVALPGTTQLAHLEENLGAADVKLDAAVLQRLDAVINRHTVVGARYNPATQTEIDTEEFA